jgi:deoxyadenosine/deoxycytidine kinase
MTPESCEKLSQRYPFISVVGAPGSGKTVFTDLLVKRTGAIRLQEPFQENPFLYDFYTKSHERFSFNAQMFFMSTNGLQTMDVSNLVMNSPVIRDAGQDVDSIIERVHWKMHWITPDQHEAYVASTRNVYKGLLKPDIYIALKASKDAVIRRIIKRDRPMELKMIEECPRYFPTLVEEFDFWLKNRLKERGGCIEVIDTEKFDIHLNDDQEKIVTETINWLNYYLLSPTQRNGFGSDGAKLIIPESFRTTPKIIVDTVPGLRITH